ncbi:MAG: hypothetical protein R2727_08410 [Bacteroidales bacterium]
MGTVKSSAGSVIKRKESPLFLVILISIVNAIGLLTGSGLLTSFSSAYKSISLFSVILFIIIGAVVILSVNRSGRTAARIIVTAILAAIAFYSAALTVHYFSYYSPGFEKSLIPHQGYNESPPDGRMSPITSSLFFLLSAAIIIIRHDFHRSVKYLGGIISLVLFIVSSLLLLGYLYRAPLLYGSQIVPVSLPTSICFWLSAVGLLRIQEVKYWTLGLFKTSSTELILLKYFLPVVIVVVIIQGVLITYISLEDNNPTLSVSLILFLVIAVTVVIVYNISSVIGKKAERAEKVLRETESKLRLNQYSRA